MTEVDYTPVIEHIKINAPRRRPELGDSYGNFDDCYTDGEDATFYDLAKMIRDLETKAGR